jgi:hypothetical protein
MCVGDVETVAVTLVGEQTGSTSVMVPAGNRVQIGRCLSKGARPLPGWRWPKEPRTRAGRVGATDGFQNLGIHPRNGDLDDRSGEWIGHPSNVRQLSEGPGQALLVPGLGIESSGTASRTEREAKVYRGVKDHSGIGKQRFVDTPTSLPLDPVVLVQGETDAANRGGA